MKLFVAVKFIFFLRALLAVVHSAVTLLTPLHVLDSSGTKQQEIVVSRGKILELLRPDPNTGKVHTLLTVEVFGVIRSLMAFRLTGGTKDYIVVGSDSGRIVILEYQPSKNVFEKIHQETFGKSGCRRIVPGQYLAVDPKGRAVMISKSACPLVLFYFFFLSWGYLFWSKFLLGIMGSISSWAACQVMRLVKGLQALRTGP